MSNQQDTTSKQDMMQSREFVFVNFNAVNLTDRPTELNVKPVWPEKGIAILEELHNSVSTDHATKCTVLYHIIDYGIKVTPI